jgi:hypothetical protein
MKIVKMDALHAIDYYVLSLQSIMNSQYAPSSFSPFLPTKEAARADQCANNKRFDSLINRKILDE